MTTRILSLLSILFLTGTISSGCSEDIPDCPSRMCIVAGGWQLTEVYVDDESYAGDFSLYRLMLTMPSPTTNTISEFSRVQPSGETDAGSWSLENDETILRLVPGNNQSLAEDWIIESMTPRKMVLIIHRDVGIKDGPAKIEFNLTPF